ncbi:hypothetical protein GCM10011391_27910 [Pullulanibacillus camelliae]|uniref:Phage holin n=1 Tax=Pullulanibacillus camelliae TaxID=1707096 RepID=A0A8J3DX02_9BACL|nr:phage holin, LLH family [Pullulanibacillus camelliae]GGE47529.1 hypothetical protein GCM10011391_27910 [Pullulanibacillus camelliae]
METHVLEYVWSAIGVFVTGLLGYAIKSAVKFIVEKNLETLAGRAVHFVEETFKDMGGQEKFKKAAEWLAKEINTNFGRFFRKKITAEKIEALVQSAVNKMRQDVKQDLNSNADLYLPARAGGEVRVNTEDNKEDNEAPQPDTVPANVSDMTTDQLKQVIADAIKAEQPNKSA